MWKAACGEKGLGLFWEVIMEESFPFRNATSSPPHSSVVAVSRESEAVSPKLRVERIPKSLFMSSLKGEVKMETKDKEKNKPFLESGKEHPPTKMKREGLDLVHRAELPSLESGSLVHSFHSTKSGNESGACDYPPLAKKEELPPREALQLETKSEVSTGVDHLEESKDNVVFRNTPLKVPPPMPNSDLSPLIRPSVQDENENENENSPVFMEATADDEKAAQAVSQGSDDASPIETFHFESSQPNKLTIGRNTTFDLDNLLNDVDFETELMELAPSLETIHEEVSQSVEKEVPNDDLVDASEMWECQVVYDYQADTAQAISVHAGQNVWGVVESGEWTQIRTEDGRVGLNLFF